ncbi:alpha/beta hydrolase [Marivirga sp. S37H4]|uniref:Alpha/beta hydrolase n=1 Tax=Marivirga aurantiaca TaxID=2802615 RepID=A0A935C7I3_9BACT|nr:alpha/beta hydrolase [Marivirga aurantiaca]MBK6264940.1 alpha/beta hydrolase [Marivirga aurantiaca]
MKTITITLAFFLFSWIAFSQNPAIYTEKSGEGNTLLLLPGFTTPGAVWEESIQHLEKQHSSIMVSYAGFNGLPAIEMPWYETIKKELRAYILKEKLNHFSIVGHSMGGMLAMELAAEFPEKIDKLILVDALPCMRALMMPGVPSTAIQYESAYNQQMLQQNDSAIAAMANLMAQNMTNNKSKINDLTQWGIEADRETFVYGYTDLLKVDLRPSLKDIKAKTIILGADFPDREIVLKNFEEQFLHLKEKSIVLAPDSKHFIMFDQPEWFYDQLNDFLSQ